MRILESGRYHPRVLILESGRYHPRVLILESGRYQPRVLTLEICLVFASHFAGQVFFSFVHQSGYIDDD